MPDPAMAVLFLGPLIIAAAMAPVVLSYLRRAVEALERIANVTRGGPLPVAATVTLSDVFAVRIAGPSRGLTEHEAPDAGAEQEG